jgi:hypothetical protein
VINLSAKAFLYGKDFDAFETNIENIKEHSEFLKEQSSLEITGPVGKLHSVIIFACRLPQRREKFANIRALPEQEVGDFNHLKVVVDNATRPNSLYAMIERALKPRDRIDRFCIDYADNMHGIYRVDYVLWACIFVGKSVGADNFENLISG